jgi:hypothetical protein
MIEYSEIIDLFFERKLFQTRDFLAACGVDDNDYAIVPFTSKLTAKKITARYQSNQFDEGDYLTELILQNKYESLHQDMGFRNANFMISYLLEDTKRIEAALNMDPKLALPEAVAAVGRDYEQYFQSDLIGIKQGIFICPAAKNNKYILFNVDVHGEIAVLVETQHPVMAALSLDTMIGADETKLASRRAKFMPA